MKGKNPSLWSRVRTTEGRVWSTCWRTLHFLLSLFEEDLRHQEGPEGDGYGHIDHDHEDHERMQHADGLLETFLWGRVSVRLSLETKIIRLAARREWPQTRDRERKFNRSTYEPSRTCDRYITVRLSTDRCPFPISSKTLNDPRPPSQVNRYNPQYNQTLIHNLNPHRDRWHVMMSTNKGSPTHDHSVIIIIIKIIIKKTTTNTETFIKNWMNL